jgi:hypothetical protein
MGSGLRTPAHRGEGFGLADVVIGPYGMDGRADSAAQYIGPYGGQEV